MLQPATCRSIVSWILVLSLLVQSPIVLASESQSDVTIRDVELRDGGVLTTRIVDSQGNPVAGESVAIEFKGKVVASTVSDGSGLVAVSGLRPGLHVIVTSTGATPFRFWSPGSAPPSAIALPAIVSDFNPELVRGQFGAFNLPMVVYAGVTIAAMVVAVNANNSADDAEDAAAVLARRVKDLEDASP